MLYFKKIIVCAVVALACNNTFADITSDYNDPNISIETLVSNALNQGIPVDYTDIIVQLQAAGADANAIELSIATMIKAIIAATKPTPLEYPKTCRQLDPDIIYQLLNAAYAALEKLGAGKEVYNQLTETVYNTVASCDINTLASIGEAVLLNPNVDPALAAAPTAAGEDDAPLVAPIRPPFTKPEPAGSAS